MLLPLEQVELDVRLDDSLAALVLDCLGEQLHESVGLYVFMDIEEALLDDLLFPVFGDYLLMKGLLFRMLYYVLHPHSLLSVVD
jgi:hypothetical protein